MLIDVTNYFCFKFFFIWCECTQIFIIYDCVRKRVSSTIDTLW